MIEPKAYPTEIIIKGVVFKVILNGTSWSNQEKRNLCDAYKEWEEQCKKDHTLTLKTNVSELWCNVIPFKVGMLSTTENDDDKFLRLSGEASASSVYKKMFDSIKKAASDLRHFLSEDPREDEELDEDGPTGGGLEEDGQLDERSVAADLKANQKRERIQRRLETGKMSAEVKEIAEYYILIFPNSLTGVGIRSERDLTEGIGRKRDSNVLKKDTPNSDMSMDGSSSEGSGRETKAKVLKKLMQKSDDNHRSNK